MSEIAPESAAPALARAQVLCELKRYPEAVQILGEALARDPQNVSGWCLMAQAEIGRERFQPAHDAAKRAAVLDPGSEWAQRLLAIAYRGLGSHEASRRCAEEAVRLAPHEWRGYVQLAFARSAVGDRRGAEEAADRGLALAPEQPSIHLAAGAVAAANGQRRRAQECFRQVLALDPDNALAHNELARLRLRRRVAANVNSGGLAAAAEGFMSGVRADPTQQVSRRNLELVLRIFLRAQAYFIFLAAWVVFLFGSSQHAPSGGSRALPLVLLALLAIYALRFVIGLPRQLRRMLVRTAFTGAVALASVGEVIAIGGLVGNAAGSGQDARAGFAMVAIVAALVARIILQATRRA